MARNSYWTTGRRGQEDGFLRGVQPRIYFKFTPTRTRQDNIKHMKAKMMANLTRSAFEAAAELEDAIKGFVSWNDHPGNHPSDNWPSPQTAYENIFATAEANGDKFSIVAGHGTDTLSEDNQGNVYTYGGILESGYLGEEHRVIHHAWEGYAGEENFADKFTQMMTGGILTGYKVNNGN